VNPRAPQNAMHAATDMHTASVCEAPTSVRAWIWSLFAKN
jgi:hypothetical protein